MFIKKQKNDNKLAPKYYVPYRSLKRKIEGTSNEGPHKAPQSGFPTVGGQLGCITKLDEMINISTS
jgi:hypothetical protein